MSNTQIDTINIRIKADSTSAENGIKRVTRLINSLNTALNSPNGINGANNFSKAITSIEESIANIDDSGFAKLDKLTEKLERFKSATQGLSMAKFTKIGVAEDTVSDPISSDKIKEASATVTGFSGKIQLAVANIKKAGTEAVAFGKKLKTDFSNSVAKATDKITMFVKALGRVAFYRMVRGMIKAVTDGFNEGIKAAYAFSVEYEKNFAHSVDTIKTALNYLHLAIGGLSAPFINILAPAIDKLVDKFVDILNVINQIAAKFGGQETWLKAIKTPISWGEDIDEATEKAKKFKATLLGIDEINKLNDNSDNPSSRGSDNSLAVVNYTEEKLQPSKWDDFIEKMRNLAEALGKVGGSVGQGFLNFWGKVADKFSEIANSDFVKNKIDKITNWLNNLDESKLEKIGEALGAISAVVLGVGFATKLYQVFESLKGIASIGAVKVSVSIVAAAVGGYTVGSLISEWLGNDPAKPVEVVVEVKEEVKEGTFLDYLGGFFKIKPGSIWEIPMRITYKGAETFGKNTSILSVLFGIDADEDIEKEIDKAWKKVEALKDKVRGAFESIRLKVQSVFESFPYYAAVNGIKLYEKVNGIKTNISTAFETARTKVKSVFESFPYYFGQAVANVKAKVPDIPNTIKTKFGEVKNLFVTELGTKGTIQTKFAEAGTRIKNEFSSAFNGIKTKWDQLKRDIADGSFNDKFVNSVKDMFTKLLNKIIRGINNALVKPFENLNKALDSLRNFSIFGGRPFSGIPQIQFTAIPELANGGMIENSGSLFVAGESGAEWVANMGNKTGVMNTNEMHDTIVDANAEQNKLIQQLVTIGTQILAKESTVKAVVTTNDVVDGMTRKNRRDGRTIVPLGV